MATPVEPKMVAPAPLLASLPVAAEEKCTPVPAA
jgi:hypothetical protein